MPQKERDSLLDDLAVVLLRSYVQEWEKQLLGIRCAIPQVDPFLVSQIAITTLIPGACIPVGVSSTAIDLAIALLSA